MVVDLPTPIDNTDATNKKYVDDNFYKSGTYLNMNNNRIADLGNPIGMKDAIHQDHIRKILV